MQRPLPAVLLTATVLFGVIPACAQTSRGTVTGVITDATRAPVPGATVNIVSNDTNVIRTTTTNEQGVYRFDAVDPGNWDVIVKLRGFRTYQSRSIPVSAAQTLGVDAVLEVGDSVSSIEVTVDSIAMQTEAPVRGGNISPLQATQLPLFSRNPNMLAITLPGVTEQRADLPGISTFSVNGSRGRSNNFLLDGTENNDISVAGQAFQVRNPDAVQEVSVQTSNYDSEFGRAGGAVVNTVTRSGTNQFHGTLGWVGDVTNDDAITSTLSLDPRIVEAGKMPPGNEQYYNGTLGGPVIRNRTFFFTSWQEQRRRATSSTVFTVPSAIGRQHILNAFPAGTNPRADLYLDVTKNVMASGQYADVDLGPGRGTAQFGTGVLSYPYRIDARQSLTKIDHRFREADLLSFRYGFDQNKNPTAGVNFPGFFTSQRQQYHNFLLTETHVFSPSLTNELRLPFNRIVFEFMNDAADPRAATMPLYTFTGIDSIGVSGSFPQGRIANNYQLQDTMNWVRGKHSFRFGFDLLRQRSRQSAPVFTRGTLDYRDSNVAGQRFSSFANFLEDYAGTGGASRDFGSPVYYPELFRQAYFFQDRWQIRDNITLTVGLRWEDFGTPANSLRTPAYAGLFNVTVDPVTQTWSAPMTEPNRTDRDLNNFSPNIGFTWSPKFDSGLLTAVFGRRKSVIRAGYTNGYDSFFNNIASNAASSSPNMVTTTVVSMPSPENVRGVAGLSQSIPNTPRLVLPIDSQNLVVKNLRNPWYGRWSFGVQRELPWGLIADASYVGSSGTGLFLNEDLNPQVLNPALRVLPAGFGSLAELQAALPAGYTLQPRLDPLQGSRTIRTNNGHSSYHSGQFQLSKRFTRDIGFSGAYTWSKLLDNGSEIFTYNSSSSLAAVPSVFGGQPLEKAVSLYDRPYRFVLTFSYLLPWMKSQTGITGHVLGGWQIAGITTLESGVPLSVSNGADADGLGGPGDRPDLNPAGRAGVRARPDSTSPTGYVNPDVLLNGRPAPIDPAEARYIGLPAGSGRTGNAGRNLERTPGLRAANVNLIRNIRMTERFLLELRAEFYNVLNHPQYGQPSLSPFAPAAGVPAANVTGSLSGRFLQYQFLDGGGRTVRYQLTLRF